MRTFHLRSSRSPNALTHGEGIEFSDGTAAFRLRDGYTFVTVGMQEVERYAYDRGYTIVPDTELADTLALANTLLAALATRFRYLPDPYGRALGYAEKLGKRAGLL